MPTQSLRSTRRHLRPAFTKTELTVIIVIVSVVLVGGCLVSALFAGIMLPALGKARSSARQLKDSTQVRGITQAFVVWASNNNSSYPVPSEFDLKDETVAAGKAPWAKDTTGNILSLMVFNGSISPEICISPAEANTGSVQCYTNYEYSNPTGAASPTNAMWDPKFRGTPEDVLGPDGNPVVGVGHQSYAHAIPLGNRRKQWGDTYNATEAVFGNRGPTYTQSDTGPSSRAWTLMAGPTGASSATLLIHGGRSTWEGNIAFNDNHVSFETTATPMTITFPTAGRRTPGKKEYTVTATGPDNLFVNESDEFEGDGNSGTVDKGINAYLRPIAQVKDPTKIRSWRD
jgi:hypothetical protein